jgi:hypothetical protein
MKTTYFVSRFDVSILQRENFITKYSQNNRFFQNFILTVQEFCGFKFYSSFTLDFPCQICCHVTNLRLLS